LLTLIRKITKNRGLYKCSACFLEVEENSTRVNSGKSIYCQKCTNAKFAPKRKSLREEYVSEYSSYGHMISRCTSPDDKDYVRYGGAGIKVCEAWLKSFEAFMLDMGPKPPGKDTIERKNYRGNYEPSNCVWASREEQNRNKSSNIILTHNDKTQTLAEHIRDMGVSADAVYKRISRGMEPLEALTKEVREYVWKEK
jgi:hypothetical protein